METKNVRAFSVKIAETSADFSIEDRIRIKDTRDSVSLEKISRDGAKVLEICAYAVLNVHNERSEDKDYKQYVFIDKDGNKYMTGSTPFFNSFLEIWEELDDAEIPTDCRKFKIYQLPSKNYTGRNFVTCSYVK